MQNRISRIKTIGSFLLIATLFIACKNKQSNRAVEKDMENTLVHGEQYTGDFIYTPEAAVFTGKTFIYGVEINDMAKELAQKVEAVKNDPHDIVTVTIVGEVSPKPEGQEGWDEIITITKIIDVNDGPTSPDVQF